jgi:putative acetyltransferase
VSLEIKAVDPRTEDVKALLQTHLEFCQSVTPPEGVYALDVERLRKPEITVFEARENGLLLGVGALRILDPSHAELKSMHTAKAARGRGVGTAMVNHLLEFARSQGVSRVSLETGNYEPFEPARKLYASFGFQPCEPFGDYLDRKSVV